MIEEEYRPKIKVPNLLYDKIMEATSLLILICSALFPVLFWNILPEIIPSHFNFSGHPDSYSSKKFIVFFPIFNLFIYGLMTVISRYPHTFNFSVKITKENALVQYRIARRALCTIKTLIIGFMLYEEAMLFNYQANSSIGAQPYVLVIFLVSLFSLIIHFYRLSKKKA
jgi:uncharacterized membrane protein